MKALTKFLLVPSVITAALALSLFIYSLINAVSPNPKRLRGYQFSEHARWILPNGDDQAGACYRYDFSIPPSQVTKAWVAISADNGFEIHVNGNTVGRWDLYRATRPFGTGLTEYGQKTYHSPSALELNFPREYQWGDHSNKRVAVFFDITNFLNSDQHNSLTVTTQARHERPAFILTGQIQLSSGQRIDLQTNEDWKAVFSPLDYTKMEWIHPTINVDHWLNAKCIPDVENQFFCFPPPGIYETAFEGRWLPIEKLADRFTTQWQVDEGEHDHWIRILSTEPYILKINGKTVRPKSGANIHQAHGQWMVRSTGRRALSVPPQMLDPDETSAVFTGKGYLTPKHGRVVDLERIDPDEGFNLNQELAGADEYGTLYKRSTEEYLVRPSTADPLNERISTRLPVAVARPYRKPDYSGFEISSFLNKGSNEVELVIFSENVDDFFGPRSKKIAVDGAGLAATGELHWGLNQHSGWQRNGEPVDQARVPVRNFQQMRFFQANTGKQLPKKAILCWLSLIFFVALLSLYRRNNRYHSAFDFWQGPLGCFVFSFVGIYLLELSIAERSEQLVVETSTLWLVAKTLIPVAIAIAVALVPFRKGIPIEGPFKSRIIVYVLLFLILCVGFVLRAYMMDLQPLDDDEYASVQASISIAEKGVPELYNGIYYTRGPVYHYMTGLMVKIFGATIVTLRIPSIIVGIFTVILSYNMCSRVIGNRRMGILAAALVAFHPFCIFTSHIARFYQQQQFFTLLVVFFFIRGFVVPAPLWKRYACVVAFGLATLSQEISLLLVVPLGFCFATMALKQSWTKEIKFLFCSCLVVAAIGINMVVFQFLCLTRVEGLSPSVESTLSPHFWEPMNAFSLLIGYSRLHVFLGFFALIGMAVALKQRALGMIAIVFFLIFGVLTTVVLVTGLGFRYQYAYLPLFIIIAVFGIHSVCQYLAADRGPKVQWIMASLLVGLAFLSYSPLKIIDSYQIRILPDSSSAVNFVKANLREGDKVAITEPHPHAALLEIGQSDYDIAQPILYDFVFREKDGRLIDRNGGAESLGRLNTLQRVVAQNERVWFVLNREKFKSRSRNLRWEYPGARMELFIRKNCPLVYQAYSWDVFLWDRAKGRYHAFRMEPEGYSE